MITILSSLMNNEVMKQESIFDPLLPDINDAAKVLPGLSERVAKFPIIGMTDEQMSGVK